MKLDFIGLGVQKSGTTTLHDILKQHSQIFLPLTKEAHFFDLTMKYERGIKWYMERFFSNSSGEKIKGVFTPEYLYFREVPRRIYDTFGVDVKFIVIFRHPVHRAVSHYNMSYRRGIEKQDFWTAIQEEENKIITSESDRAHYSYIDRGYYGIQLKRYLDLFPIENFLFLVFEEDIIRNVSETVKKIQTFLGVEYECLETDIKSNEAYLPKSVTLNRIIRNNDLIKSLGKILLPHRKWRKVLRKRIEEGNKSYKKRKFCLSEEETNKLFYQYFFEDVKQLELLTGRNLQDVWYK